jgi:guanylate kinase
MSGSLFIVSAPSGAGKTSLVAALLASDSRARKSVSYTTRSPRPGEANGREYHFVTTGEFEQMLRDDAFLEWALVHENRYGTGKRAVAAQRAEGHDVVLEIDWQGAAQIRRLEPQAVSVFILPPSLEALESRMTQRGQDSPAVIARRLANAREEIRHVDEFDYVIINEEFNRAAEELAGILRTERLKCGRQLAHHADLINRMK